MEAPRPLRTADHDKPHSATNSAPRPPNELESYLAALSLFSGEPRERGMPLDTILVGPAAAVSLPNDKQTPTAMATEKLAAQYTTASSTLTLQAGSRATEVLVRLIAGGGSVGGVGGPSAGMGGMCKLVLSGVKFRLSILEAASTSGSTNIEQGGLAQVRILEIRSCSLAPKGDGPFATPILPHRPSQIQRTYTSPTPNQGFSIPPSPARQYSVPPTPYESPSTPAQQSSVPTTPTLGATHTLRPTPPPNANTTAAQSGSHTHEANTYASFNAGNAYTPSLGLGLGLGTSHLGGGTPGTPQPPSAPHASSHPTAHTPNPLSTHMPIPSSLTTHVSSPLATHGSSPQGSNTPTVHNTLANLHIPTYVSGSARLAQLGQITTPPSTSSNKPSVPDSERATPVIGDAARRRESSGTVRAESVDGSMNTEDNGEVKAGPRRKSGGEKVGNVEGGGEKFTRASSDGAVRVSTAAAVRALTADLVRSSSSAGVVRVSGDGSVHTAENKARSPLVNGAFTKPNGDVLDGAVPASTNAEQNDSVESKTKASGSVYSEGTTHASAGTGSGDESDSGSGLEQDESKSEEENVKNRELAQGATSKSAVADSGNQVVESPKKDVEPLSNSPIPTPAPETDKEPVTPTDDNPLSPMSSSSGGTYQPNANENEEDETDSNEADGGSEFGHLTFDDSGDEEEGTRTPNLRVRDRPGTPGPRSGGKRGSSTAGTKSGSTLGTKTETVGSTSSVNGGTTPRMSGMNTPLASGSGANTPQISVGASQMSGTATPANPYLNNLRNGLHSASMSNLRAAAQNSTTSQLQNSASSSNLHATFAARTQTMHASSPSSSNTPTPTNATPQNSFNASNPSLNAARGRSTVPTPKQGGVTYGFAPYATGMPATGFGGSASVPPNGTPMPSSNRPSFSSAQGFSGRPSFSATQPSSSSTFPTTQSSFNTFRGQYSNALPPQDEDPDIGLLSALSFHMPSLEEVRIVRSTVRGSALVRFIEARNGSSEGHSYGHESALSDDETDWDSESGSESDMESGIAMGNQGPGMGARMKKKSVRAGVGAPILSLELVECPYVNAEHVRALRESVDDVRWKPYTFVGVSATIF